MRVIVAGCGRVGATVASELDAGGHDVVVVDRDRQAFRRLADGFAGATVEGVVFDRRVLLDAGVEDATAFVAVTSGDNSNVVAARVARERFGVPRVVARIYDPARASIYERHGITTIASARWTSDAILAHLQPAEHTVDHTIGPGEGDVVMISHELPEGLPPIDPARLNRQGAWLLCAVTRTGVTTVAVPRELVQGGETVHLAVQRSHLEAAAAFLDELDEEAP